MTRKNRKKKKKFDIITFILVLVLLTGVGIMAYPSVSNYWNSLHSARIVASYVEAVEDLSDEQYEKILTDARSYNTSLTAKSNQWNLTDEETSAYDTLLNPGETGVMGTIEIPCINVSLPIYHGISEGVLRIGVGHLEGSSLPVGGTGTHAVLCGHRGLTSATLFSNLDKVVEGDLFYITIMDETLVYEVDQILIVEPDDTSALAIDPEQDYVTLLTCTPYGVNTHRLLVRGHRVYPDDDSVVIVTGEASVVRQYLVAPFLAVPIFLIIIIFIFFGPGRKKSSKKKKLKAEMSEAEE